MKESEKTFALTYPQLMNQALKLDLGRKDLDLLRRGYELAERMFDGYYRAQGMPFICHLIRTASIVLEERQPMTVAVAALLHSAYLTGQFQEGRGSEPSAPHREEVRTAVGTEAEALIEAYHRTPWRASGAIKEHLNHLDNYSFGMKNILIMRLANELEDYLDLAMAYRKKGFCVETMNASAARVLELASRLGLATIAEGLALAYEDYVNLQLPEGIKRNHRVFYEHSERIWQKLSPYGKSRALGRKFLKRLLRAPRRQTENIGAA